VSGAELLGTLDSMGAWTEAMDIAWLPKRLHDRNSARALFRAESGCDFIDVRCRTVWIYPDYDNPWLGEPGVPTWTECDRDRAAAIEAWRVSERGAK
jgi:hypothetical protein